ncbi:MAG TPA: hypothetical protein VHJ40_00375 [Actinomycetota bacterium]|jgi:hypothetical protein|nr:hypothetical protein [Actinomycetota bacterium]
MDDERLLRLAEQTLAEIDRSSGLIDEHAEVLAALRLRLFGVSRKSLDDAIKAAGELKGRRRLEDLDVPKSRGSLEDAFKMPEKKKEWPTG